MGMLDTAMLYNSDGGNEDILDETHRKHLNDMIREATIGSNNKQNAEVDDQSGLGLFASIFRWGGSSSTLSNLEKSEGGVLGKEGLLAREYGMECVNACYLSAFVSDSRVLEDQALVSLCLCLVEYINNENEVSVKEGEVVEEEDTDLVPTMIQDTDNNIQIFCIIMLTEIALRYRHTYYCIYILC